MLVRIVKLTFKKENISSFEKLFEQTKQEIRNFDGCNFLEIYQELEKPNVFFTYSYWENEEVLDEYRNSDFFKSVWSKTKILFDAKPEAWSVHKRASLS
ncbi:antibiotic biosynthesis monooxygenase [Croceitalea sp. MTPC9]|uniref:putative quinol monooxygenase n=1 Tax=unclassified Croceitalea TaxID=2632280 RepID=UPI002B3A1CCC|nr:antibiotic biosynthesis monooxygenase [Croceitalea sp. MTPC6]GMN15966.1 antibiotic biosynthesis monooxygenase [Croceitalea sp. MTPC9]